MGQLEFLTFVQLNETEMWIFTDEYDNRIAPFFWELDAIEQFKASGLMPDGAVLEPMPYSSAMPAVVACIKDEAGFFAVNPTSRDTFKALTAEEFLLELIGMAYEDGWSDGDDEDAT